MDVNETNDFLLTDNEVKSPIETIKSSLEDVWKNLAGYCLAGLGFNVAVLTWVVVILATAAVVVSPSFFLENQLFVALCFLGGGLVYLVGLLALGFWIVPQYLASLLRAIAGHRYQQGQLGFKSAWLHKKDSRKDVSVVYALTQFLILIGTLLCIFPGFILAFATVYALPLVALYDRPPVDAVKQSYHAFKSNLGWHLPFIFLAGLTVTCISLVPILGFLVVQPLMMRLHIAAMEPTFGRIPLR